MLTPATAYWNQRQSLSHILPRLKAMGETVGHLSDLTHAQWAQITAMALEFKPDLIIELGRGKGNSTCIFTEVANALGGREKCRVISLCMTSDFAEETIPKLFSRKLVNKSWFQPLDCWIDDILAFDYKKEIGDAKRVMVFWDAHGFEIAGCVLGSILPEIVNRSHMVIMHDLSDQRYLDKKTLEYGGQKIWNGNNWEGPRLVLGHINSAVEQAVSIVDFSCRNGFEPTSADHCYHTEIKPFPEKMGELTRLLGNDFFSLSGHWFCFSLNDLPGPFTFPAFTKPSTTLVASPQEMITGLGLRTETASEAAPGCGTHMQLNLVDVSNKPAVEAMFGARTDLHTPWNWASRAVASYIKPGSRVLDLASGHGNPYILDACRKCGAQLEMVYILTPPADLPPSAHYTQWDLTSGPPPVQGPFDCVVSISSLEHMPEESRVRLLSWAKDVLAPGGVIAFSVGHLVGIDDFERVRTTMEHDIFFTQRHCQVFLPLDITTLLRALTVPENVILSGKIDRFPGMPGYEDSVWRQNDWLCREEYVSHPELADKPWMAGLSAVEIVVSAQRIK